MQIVFSAGPILYHVDDDNQDLIEIDEMSAKLFTKLGVQDMDEVIHSVNSIAGNRERGMFMMDHITSCNKVSND